MRQRVNASNARNDGHVAMDSELFWFLPTNCSKSAAHAATHVQWSAVGVHTVTWQTTSLQLF